MKKRPISFRLTALVLTAALGLTFQTQPVWAEEGGWARKAGETALSALTTAWQTAMGIFKSEDSVIELGKTLEGVAQKKNAVQQAERQLTRSEERLNGVKDIVDTIDRHKDAVENIKNRVTQLRGEANQAKKEGEGKVEEWERAVKQLLADKDRVEQRISDVLGRPDPPACPFMKKKIDYLRALIREYQTQYLRANEKARITAAYALTGWKTHIGIWGTMILSIVALWSNIVTTLAIVGDAVVAVRTLYTGALKAVKSCWGLLKTAVSTLDNIWMKFEKIMSDSKALKAFLQGIVENIGGLFTILIEQATRILNVITDKISKIGQLLKDFFVRDAWGLLKTLWEDVRQINSVGQAGKLAVAKAQEAWAAGKRKSTELLTRYNEATADQIDAYNFAESAVQSAEDQAKQVDVAKNKALDYAEKTAKVVDDLTIQWNDYQEKIQEARQLRQDILRAEHEFETSLKQMSDYLNMLTEAIRELEKLLDTRCLNTA